MKYFAFLILIFLNINLYADEYFQQEVQYEIRVRLDDKKHELSGFEKIEYINRSKDILKEIRMHVWPNAYSTNESALARQLSSIYGNRFDFSDNETRGFMDSLDFKINEQKVSWKYDSIHTDIVHIYLNEGLKPGEQLSISTPFHVKIPDGLVSRLGHLGQSYQITQWYPKPAVYDRYGWHDMPYLTQGEFYSEYGSFDVQISVPKNYVVGATGELQEEEELNWLNAKAEATAKSDFKDTGTEFPESDKEYKTISFKQTKIHDFAWFADKRYHVLKGEVELPHSKKKVILWSMFTNEEAFLWKKSIQYLHDAVYYYSLWVGDYPYSHATAVYGSISAGGGMEYPNITVIGRSSNAAALDLVIAHEVGHNWFYGILGSNERTHPWMDEGINSYYEDRYIEQTKKYRDSSALIDIPIKEIKNLTHKDLFELSYFASARIHNDQPLSLAADKFTYSNYGTIVYAKSALLFKYLESYLGTEVFDNAMQSYFEAWKFKHPYPADIKKIFESSSNKNLSWFFDSIIHSNEKMDYKIKRFNKKENLLRIVNNTDLTIPFSISAVKDHKEIKTIWNEGFSGMKDIPFPEGDYDSFVIDYQKNIPEINRQNNTLRTSGLFKKTEPLQFKFIGGLENPRKTQIFYMPLTGWNSYDKWMPGIAFYNPLFPAKNFEYVIMPMYSIHTKSLSGGMNISYKLYGNNSVIKSFKIGLSAATYSYRNYSIYNPGNVTLGEIKNLTGNLKFYKLTPYINITFNKTKVHGFNNSVMIRLVNVVEENVIPSVIFNDVYTFNQHTNVLDVSYKMQQNTKSSNWLAHLNFQQSADFAKINLEGFYKIKYKKGNKGINLRVFAGKFIYDSNTNFNFKMAGWNGFQDNLYDYTFIGRNENMYLPSKQFVEMDGGFKIATNIGRTNNWLTAANIKIPFPGRIPFGVYADIGTYDGAGSLFPGSQSLMYNAGLMITYDFFGIYIPLTSSSDIEHEQKINNKTWKEQIRFTLYLDTLNPLEIIKNISF